MFENINHPNILCSYTKANTRLRSRVAPVNDEVRSSSVGGGIAGEVQVGALEFFGQTFTAQRDLALPEILRLLRDEVGDLSGNVSRRDGVGTREPRPLNGKGLD